MGQRRDHKLFWKARFNLCCEWGRDLQLILYGEIREGWIQRSFSLVQRPGEFVNSEHSINRLAKQLPILFIYCRWQISAAGGFRTDSMLKLVIPISEPIGRAACDAGNHWTMGVIDCTRRRVEYWDSLDGIGNSEAFYKVAHENPLMN